jgi:hypothetical protein
MACRIGADAMAAGAITIYQVAAKTNTLVVKCTRCERAERYPLPTLIQRYGRSLPIPLLLRSLSADCPKRASRSTYDLCGIYCPDLPELFLPEKTQRN